MDPRRIGCTSPPGLTQLLIWVAGEARAEVITLTGCL